jgi:flagella synthesis protein FlgN
MSSLLPHLLAESAGIEEYLALLAEEERAMADGRFKDLPALTARKAALQERMAELDRQREARQLALGFAGGRAGADAAAQAGGEATCTAWAALLGLAERAKAANRRNALWCSATWTSRRTPCASCATAGSCSTGRMARARRRAAPEPAWRWAERLPTSFETS